MFLHRQLLLLPLVGLVLVKYGCSSFVQPHFRYLNFEGVELRLPVSSFLASDAVRLILGAEDAATIVLPDYPLVSILYGSLVDTSMLMSKYMPDDVLYGYNGFLRVSLLDLRRQDDDTPFALPIHGFFNTMNRKFYDPFFNENAPMTPVDGAIYDDEGRITMYLDLDSFAVNDTYEMRCKTKDDDIEDLLTLLQDELYLTPSAGEDFAPKVCTIPEFCDDISMLTDAGIHVDNNLFITKRVRKTRVLCQVSVVVEISDLFRHFTLLEGFYFDETTPITGLYMQLSMWIGVKYTGEL